MMSNDNKPDFKLFNEIFNLRTSANILQGILTNPEKIEFYENILNTESTFLTIGQLENSLKKDKIENIKIYKSELDSNTNKIYSSIVVEPSGDSKTMSFFDRSIKDITNLDLFFNTIPTIELAQLVPYLSIKFMFKVDENKKEYDSYLSLQNFLTLDIGNNPVKDAMNAAQVYDTKDPAFEEYAGMKKVALEGKYFITDESIYTSPATLSDNFKPLMSISKIDIKVTPTVDYAVAFEEFNLSLTVHDRTKLGKFPHLFGVEYRDQVFAIIEYGWSHPGDYTTDHYAYFFNKVLRKKSVCKLTNASYNFDEIGQVKADMKLHTMGSESLFVTQFHKNDGVIMAEQRLKTLNNSIKTFLNKAEFPVGLRGSILLQSLSSGIVEKIDEADNKKLNEFISSLEKAKKNDVKSINALKSAISEYKKHLQDPKTSRKYAINQIILDSFTSFNTWLKEYRKKNNYSVKDSNKGDVYLHEVFTYFVSKNLLEIETRVVNETQMIYYNFSDESIPDVKNCSIGNFMIFKDDLKSIILNNKETHNYTIEQFINLILQKFVSDLKTPFYGLSQRNESIYSDAEKVASKAISDSNKSVEKKLKALKENGVEIKEPKVVFRIENLNSIIRIHIFDQTKILNLMPSVEEQNLLSIILKDKESIKNLIEQNKKDINANIELLNSKKTKTFDELKSRYKNLYPGINLNGSSTNVVKTFQLSNSMDPATTTHLILQNQKKIDEGDRNQSQDAPAHNKIDKIDDLYIKMIPGKITMQTLGFPIADVHQTFFVDLNTGTDVDNIYNIISVSHSLEAGSFKTNLELANADSFGSHTNIYSQIRRIDNIIKGELTVYTQEDFPVAKQNAAGAVKKKK